MRFSGALILGLATIQGTLAQDGLTPQPSNVQPPVSSAPDAPSSDAPVVSSPPESVAPTDGGDSQTTADVSEPAPTSDAAGPSSDSGDSSVASDSSEATATGDSTDTTVTGVSATATDSESATGTATTTSSSSTATSTTAITAAKLDDATTGQNAEVTEVDGKPAVVLKAPAGGEATFSVDTTTPEDVKDGEQIRIVASIKVEQVLQSARRRGLWNREVDPSCQLKMSIDGATAYDEPVSATKAGGNLELASNAVQATSKKPKVDVSQVCNDKPVSVTFTNLSVTGANSGIMSPSDGGNGGNGNDSGNKSGNGDDGNAAMSIKTPALWATCVVATVFAFLF